MRQFNKIFVIALPRCATVSICEALGLLGVPTAHLGRIYGEDTLEHHDAQRLARIHQQIVNGDYELDILRQCRGLVDYPACALAVMQRLDQQYPGSLFVNVRRDHDIERWIQSVERQFIGLELLTQGNGAPPRAQQFMRVMLALREMTFGQSRFHAEDYVSAYHRHQQSVQQYFAGRPGDLLQISGIAELEISGFQQICEFLDCPTLELPFPASNDHSLQPSREFMNAVEEGRVVSQTGIKPANC